MKSQTIQNGGFSWHYWPNPKTTDRTIIVALGGATDTGLITRAAISFVHTSGCNAATFIPALDGKPYDGWHDFPLERIQDMARWLLAHGSTRVGIAGASTTSLVSLAAASYIPELTLVLSFATEDYNTEGFYMDNTVKIGMRPAPGCSMFTWQGRQVPYCPTGLTAERMGELLRMGKGQKNFVDALDLCRYYESLPGFEETLLPVERSHAHICSFGADTDTGCDSGAMARRLEKRLLDAGYAYGIDIHVFPKCSHYQFPQGMVKKLLPFGSQLLFGKMWEVERQYPEECRAAREEIDRICRAAIQNWQIP